MASTAFARERIDLDHPATWPKAVCAFLAEHHELFLRWETRQGGVSAQMFDGAIVGLANVLQPHEMGGLALHASHRPRDRKDLPQWHAATRTVRCSRAASTLSRKRVALHPMSRGFSNPEIKRTRRTAPARSGFAFSHRGELAKTELDGSSATGVAKRSTTRMNVTRCRRRLSAASGHRASSKQTCRLQLWLGIVVSSSTSFDDSWLDGAYLDKVRQTMRGRIVRPLPAANVRRVIRFPSPDFLELTRCLEWVRPISKTHKV